MSSEILGTRMLSTPAGVRMSTGPVDRSPFQAHHRENPDGVIPVEQRVLENGARDPADRTEDGRCSFRVFGGMRAGVFDFGEKSGAQRAAFTFAILSRLVEFSFRQLVERDTHPTSSVSGHPREHQMPGGWPCRPRRHPGAGLPQPGAVRSPRP